MRYSLVSSLACPVCQGDVVAIVTREVPADMPAGRRGVSDRVAPAGAIVAPWGPRPIPPPLGEVLTRYTAPPAPGERDFTVEVDEGLLVCASCRRWFPVVGSLPELLPDYLRDPVRDDGLFAERGRALPADLLKALSAHAPPPQPDASDDGAAFKRAEIWIEAKVGDPGFFAPGYASPFNQQDTTFTLDLIGRFASAVPLLELQGGEVVLDSGCGYGWTTEWLFKAGTDAIGVDICRTYLEIGIRRMGPNRPHLIVGDVEHLPLRTASIDAVLAYESFHHVPDRRRAMASYARVLRQDGRVVLAEPGAAHEHAQVSVDVMKKYGILEKGMELTDVNRYVEGAPFGAPEQIYSLRASGRELGARLDRAFVRTHPATEGNLFRIRRTDGVLAAALSAAREPRRLVWPRVKRRIRAALIRLGLE